MDTTVPGPSVASRGHAGPVLIPDVVAPPGTVVAVSASDETAETVTALHPGQGAAATDTVVDTEVSLEPATDATPLLTGMPSGGGIRGAFAGLEDLRVPPLRSVLRTAVSLALMLVFLAATMAGLDAWLEGLLDAPRLSLRTASGVVGLAAGVGAVVLLFDVALDAPLQPRGHVERRRLRLACGLVLLVVAFVGALLWSRGLTAV